MGLNGYVVIGSAIVGLLVGLTGAGGGALMTPMLILLFNVKPAAAISSDLVAAVVMRPVGAAVHLRRGTVNLRLVGLMTLGWCRWPSSAHTCCACLATPLPARRTWRSCWAPRCWPARPPWWSGSSWTASPARVPAGWVFSTLALSPTPVVAGVEPRAVPLPSAAAWGVRA